MSDPGQALLRYSQYRKDKSIYREVSVCGPCLKLLSSGVPLEEVIRQKSTPEGEAALAALATPTSPKPVVRIAPTPPAPKRTNLLGRSVLRTVSRIPTNHTIPEGEPDAKA